MDDMQIFFTFIPTCFFCFCPHCLTIIFLPRGAELVDDHVRTQLDAVRREDKGKMDRIKKS